MDKDVTASFLPECADDRLRYARIVAILATGLVRLLAADCAGVNPAVDLSPDVRVTTTTARPGAGDKL